MTLDRAGRCFGWAAMILFTLKGIVWILLAAAGAFGVAGL